jgi:UDP-N-acetyl-D-mannosaminuronic acid dehydrogenase
VSTKTLCVVGLGYIGLPTAAMFATHGVRVIGVDSNPQVIDVLRRGDIHIEEVGLLEVVRDAMESGALTVQSTPSPADSFIIAVPTPFNSDKTADMRSVISAGESLVTHLRSGNLVILESTSPPKTTTDLVRPILERSGLKAGDDFQLAYSPERVLPGQILHELVSNARVIGGIDERSARAGRDLYAAFVKGEILLTDATTAEMVKLMENTTRDVNIALANEFALIAEHLGIDVWEAIHLANYHPRVKILRPGPGVGGHCIAIDPWFLVEAAPHCANLIRQARRVNDAMPHHAVSIVERLVDGTAGAAVACLGLAYKADVDDTRESPAVEIAELLSRKGFDVRVFDPHAPEARVGGAQTAGSLADAVRGADVCAVLVDHAEFRGLAAHQLAGMRGKVVIDMRSCLDAASLRRDGFTVAVLGSRT